MTMNHDRFEILCPVQKFAPDPKQVFFALAVDRNLRPDAGMDEVIVAKPAKELQSFKKTKVRRRQRGPELPRRLGQPFPVAPHRVLHRVHGDAVGQKGEIAAVAQPAQAWRRVAIEGEEKVLVISF